MNFMVTSRLGRSSAGLGGGGTSFFPWANAALTARAAKHIVIKRRFIIAFSFKTVPAGRRHHKVRQREPWPWPRDSPVVLRRKERTGGRFLCPPPRLDYKQLNSAPRHHSACLP